MTALERLRRIVGPCPGGTPCPGSTSENPDCPESCEDGLSDEALKALLDECGGNVAVAAYQALLYKSQNTGLTLASGLRLPDQSGHYRRLARLYRPQGRGMLARADEPAYTTKGVSEE